MRTKNDCANCRHEYKDYGMEFCKKHENPMDDVSAEKCGDYEREVEVEESEKIS